MLRLQCSDGDKAIQARRTPSPGHVAVPDQLQVAENSRRRREEMGSAFLAPCFSWKTFPHTSSQWVTKSLTRLSLVRLSHRGSRMVAPETSPHFPVARSSSLSLARRRQQKKNLTTPAIKAVATRPPLPSGTSSPDGSPDSPEWRFLKRPKVRPATFPPPELSTPRTPRYTYCTDAKPEERIGVM